MKIRKMVNASSALLLAAVLCSPLAAHAGRNCDAAPPDAASTQKAIRLAKQVREAVNASGANVVMLGRIGSDQSKRGVRYTHVGYLFRNHPAGAWTVEHELNACGSGNSELFDEGLANFYMDDVFEFETRIVIPSPDVQERLAKTLQGPMKRVLHEAKYSSIANPWSTLFQNSDGWAIEIAAAAIEPDAVHNREQAQRWLREHRYHPGKIHIGGGERAGARLFTPNIRFGDHPDTAWQTESYETHTGDSALNFLRQIDPGSKEIVQRLDGKPAIAAKPVAMAASPAEKNDKSAEKAQPTAPAVQPAQQPVASLPTAASPTTGASRAQLLQSMQGLIVSYACRPQGYLNQCRQIDPGPCGKQVADAVLRCFATVSDQQLTGGTEQAAMQQMQEIGYCAVESVDASFAGKPAQTTQGAPCPAVRDYR